MSTPRKRPNDAEIADVAHRLLDLMEQAKRRGDEQAGLMFSAGVAALSWVLGIGPPPPGVKP